MRQVLFTPQAARALDDQIVYLLSRDAATAAEALAVRVRAFLEQTIAVYPRTGRYIPSYDVWEAWIPGTRLVTWYRFDDASLVVLDFWHVAQDRGA